MAKRSIHDDDLDEDDYGDLDDDDDDVGEGEGLFARGLSKPMVTFIVVIVVFVAAVLGTLLYYNLGEGTVQGVVLTPPSRADDLFTFAYSIQTDHGLATGSATFLAQTGGQTTYTRDFDVNPGGGQLQVHADDFVIGNGEYTFRLQFKGFEGRSNYTIGVVDHTNFVVTSVRVDSRLVYPDNLKVGALQISVNFFSDQANNIYALTPENTSISVKISKNGVQDGPLINQRVDGSPYRNFNVTPTLGAGNYTVNVTFTNNWVRSDSAYQTLYDQNRTYVHNKPTACVSPTTYKANNANGYTITVDGSCSTDDTGVSRYNWDFATGAGEVSNGSSPFETWTFPSTPRTYTCQLRVQDIGIPGVPESEQDGFVEFTVQVSFL